jgi:hypothetical protein
MDIRDWFVLGCISFVGLAATVFLFVHPSPTNFATFAGLQVTLMSAYHWMVVRDSKEKDAS